MLIALALVELLMPSLAAFLEADLSVSYFGAEGIVLPVLLLVLSSASSAASIRPSSSPLPAGDRAQGQQVLVGDAGHGAVSNVLVVAQFAVSIGLIICTAMIYGQTVYARTSIRATTRSTSSRSTSSPATS